MKKRPVALMFAEKPSVIGHKGPMAIVPPWIAWFLFRFYSVVGTLVELGAGKFKCSECGAKYFIKDASLLRKKFMCDTCKSWIRYRG